jgi:hypothetical protein
MLQNAPTTKAWYLSQKKFAAACDSQQHNDLLRRVSQSGERIISLRVWGIAQRPDGSVLFVYATLETSAKPGFKEEVVLRGDSLTVLLRIRTETSTYVVLVRQYRGPMGGYVYEPPAGMRDGALHVRSKTLTEIHEETGILVEEDDLCELGSPAMTSPGLLDERIQLYTADISRTEEFVRGLRGYRGGVPGEHEMTTVVVVPWSESILLAWAGGDLKFRAMYYEVLALSL